MTPPRVPLDPAFLARPLAHRALHGPGRPENSRAAIRAAIAAGYGIEIDVQLSSDGVPMVFHDDDLGRLTAQAGPVTARTALDLSAIPLTGGDEGIPTLAQVLDLVAGRVPLLIEVKRQPGGPGRLATATADALHGYDGPVAIMSFDPREVLQAGHDAPAIPRGIVTSAYGDDWTEIDAATRDRLRAIPDADATGASFISHEAADLSRPRVSELKAQGLAILCWTVRSPQAEAAARTVADNITFEGYRA